MAASNIEWTGETWNPISGCTRAGPDCDNCYAVPMTRRLEKMGQVAKYGGLVVLNNAGKRHFNGVVRTHGDVLTVPLRWKTPRTVFVNSMSDLFHRDVPVAFIGRVYDVMAEAHRHTFQILTKRTDRAADILPIFSTRHTTKNDTGWPLANVHLGGSAGNQEMFNKRIAGLLDCPTALRFLSLEPLIGPIVIPDVVESTRGIWFEPLRPIRAGIGWVIVGGESGHGARPCDVQWIRSIVRQCQTAGVPVFVKQLGANVIDSQASSADTVAAAECWPEGTKTDGHRILLHSPKGSDMAEWPEDLRIRQMPAKAVA